MARTVADRTRPHRHRVGREGHDAGDGGTATRSARIGESAERRRRGPVGLTGQHDRTLLHHTAERRRGDRVLHLPGHVEQVARLLGRSRSSGVPPSAARRPGELRSRDDESRPGHPLEQRRVARRRGGEAVPEHDQRPRPATRARHPDGRPQHADPARGQRVVEPRWDRDRSRYVTSIRLTDSMVGTTWGGETWGGEIEVVWRPGWSATCPAPWRHSRRPHHRPRRHRARRSPPTVIGRTADVACRHRGSTCGGVPVASRGTVLRSAPATHHDRRSRP